MRDTMSVREAAGLWNLTERRVSGLCKEGKIKGARKQGHFWLIPADAQKPADNRVKTGAYKRITVLPDGLCHWHFRLSSGII